MVINIFLNLTHPKFIIQFLMIYTCMYVSNKIKIAEIYRIQSVETSYPKQLTCIVFAKHPTGMWQEMGMGGVRVLVSFLILSSGLCILVC